MAVFVANPGLQAGVSYVLGQKRSRPGRRPTTKGLKGPGCSSEGGCPLEGPGYSSETMSQVKWAMMPAQKPAMVWAPMALLMSLR